MGLFGGGKSKHNHWDKSKPCIACLEEKNRGANVDNGDSLSLGGLSSVSAGTATEMASRVTANDSSMMSRMLTTVRATVSPTDRDKALKELKQERIAVTDSLNTMTARLIENAENGLIDERDRPGEDTYTLERKGGPGQEKWVVKEKYTSLSYVYHPVEDLEVTERARAISLAAHQGQVDKLGVPYHHHPAGVVTLLKVSEEYYNLSPQEKEDAIAAAYLHDVVEDTDVSLEDLRQMGFSEGTIAAVDAISTREGEDKDTYYARVVAAGPVARALKLADLSHNNLPSRRAKLPGAPGVPLKVDDPKGGDMYGRLGKKYAKAYKSLGAEVPDHLKQFAA